LFFFVSEHIIEKATKKQYHISPVTKSFIQNLNLLVFIVLNSTIISKCYYEGDFTVYCNTTNIPISSDTVEIMRSAKVINGIQYKEDFCSFTNLTCHTEQSLSQCIDKQSCEIKNSWFPIAECSGNSYYTEFEYDCQPSKYQSASFIYC
jgi:hypothetical protein